METWGIIGVPIPLTLLDALQQIKRKKGEMDNERAYFETYKRD